MLRACLCIQRLVCVHVQVGAVGVVLLALEASCDARLSTQGILALTGAGHQPCKESATCREASRQAGRQAGRRKDRQAGRRAGRQADRTKSRRRRCGDRENDRDKNEQPQAQYLHFLPARTKHPLLCARKRAWQSDLPHGLLCGILARLAFDQDDCPK